MLHLDMPVIKYAMAARCHYIFQIISFTTRVSYANQQNVLFLICAFNVVVWFALYAYFQEKLTIHGDAPPELVVMCPQYFIYTVVACCGLFIKRASTRKEKCSSARASIGTVQQPPWHAFVFIAAATFGSYYFSFRALRHVSYLLKVLGKTCKPIPILLVGLCFGKTYPLRKYTSVLLITAGAALFFLSQTQSRTSLSSAPHDDSSDSAPLMGVALLTLSLFCDGLAGALEDKYIAEFNVGPFDLMFRISWASCGFCAVLLGRDWMTLVMGLSQDKWLLIALIGICGGLGQVFMFLSIATFGSLSTSVVGTCRKMITVLSSIYMFEHSLSPGQLAGLFLAFLGMVFSTAAAKSKHSSAPHQDPACDIMPQAPMELNDFCTVHQRKDPANVDHVV
ncbi:hypothetical protein H310_01816 [Aphanomyces invadans]|uniref:EamA domain-containing protein n=1 Tax=Aphanomyces invadans TaxID=157072 RepID=A0A024UN19_9STRA|nr:hypothetical protein H310_01816 [Aphanomyces invadans]ETW07252.1 hypothetical protein H310_01816 [Aphanomyces invadans]|eukprot:XP_008863345.1 hypothetical protein H310_01816 [Aphanomyces invadans]